MEARSLTQKDRWKTFGSKEITSEVLHGKRSISKVQARKLADFFHVSADLFIWRYLAAWGYLTTLGREPRRVELDCDEMVRAENSAV